MESFSRRMGIKPEKAIQIESMDDDLKNSLWNVLHSIFWQHSESSNIGPDRPSANLESICRSLWYNHFKDPIDEVELRNWPSTRTELKRRYLRSDWAAVYDWIEFLARPAEQMGRGASTLYQDTTNRVLKRENAGYRFIKGEIVPISNEEEVAAVEEVLDNSPAAVRRHISSALGKLADRDNPDYANCIKESIQAVEAAAKIVGNDPKGDLGSALKRFNLHADLKKGILSIYKYTCDADIRHASLEHSADDITINDARFMLITCSAIANYLLSLS